MHCSGVFCPEHELNTRQRRTGMNAGKHRFICTDCIPGQLFLSMNVIQSLKLAIDRGLRTYNN